MVELKELEALKTALRSADSQDTEMFHELLQRAMSLLNLGDKDLAHQFNVSRPTVSRWRTGKNAPHPAMRTPIYSWLAKKATKAISSKDRILVPAG